MMVEPFHSLTAPPKAFQSCERTGHGPLGRLLFPTLQQPWMAGGLVFGNLLVLSLLARSFTNKITQGLHDLVGDGLLTTDGDFHRWHRRLVQPSFSKRRVENYAEMIVQYTQETVEHWQPGAEIDIAHDMQALILRMIMKILVNIDVVQQDSEVGQILDAVLAHPSGTSPPYHAASKTWSTYEIGACSRHT